MNQQLFLSSTPQHPRMIAIAYASGKGWLTTADAGALTSIFEPLGVLAGPFIWSLYSNYGVKLVPHDSVAVHLDNILTAVNPVGGIAVIQDNNVPGKQIAAKIVGALLIGFFVLMPHNVYAQTKRVDSVQQFNNKLKSDFSAATGTKATGDVPFDLLQALDVKLLPDLQYALLLANATGNTITADCYNAWIAIITTQQTAVADKTGTPITIPDPHLVTDFERAVEIRNMLQPQSTFMIKCSPVANMIKQDVIQFMGIVISGGAGLATMVPGL